MYSPTVKTAPSIRTGLPFCVIYQVPVNAAGLASATLRHKETDHRQDNVENDRLLREVPGKKHECNADRQKNAGPGEDHEQEQAGCFSEPLTERRKIEKPLKK